jgi:class 3 adenylate cyclase/tetratricopeptide (TPR) repeat protein
VLRVPICTSCGAESREGARFCDACGAALAGALVAREQRKTVTVLFCDLSGSTALGERLDPESLRRVLGRYFETAREAVERHGGTVEKFIGDAVMAVFGVPVVHEDDALRCVRAAADVRDAIGPLNAELAQDYGTTLALRIGISTGEVVAGTEERLATGDTVNVAARLEQAAQPGEILLGEETVRILRDAVEVEALEPLALRGKGEPVRAFRLITVSDAAPARRLDVPIVGRERELRLLANAWERVVTERSCHLFTLLGAAGVGKSRLVAEFLDGLTEARVVRGRCLSYGDGITYWPVVEVLKQLPQASSLALEPQAVAAVRAVLGDDSAVASTDEIAWGVRKLLEAAAGVDPLVCVLDDLHWGEPTFLDLVEHVADLSRDAPILLLTMARPELLELRPGWGGGKLNASSVLLEPLSAAETDLLMDELLGDGEVGDDLRARIRERAEGNPLFVEEMLAIVGDARGELVEVPPTINALLAARLDQLDPAERGVLERGAVEGRIFHQGAVQALAPDEPHVPARLTALVRKELVRPDRTQIPGDDAFRFRHLLIRDAAYDGLPKAVRAELHERFAAWLEEHGADLVELDEIVGYHLEQAYRYRAELGPVDEAGRRIGDSAGRRLAAAGRRALVRDDVRAAITLLERARSLPAAGRADVDLGLELVDALFSGGRAAEAVQLAGLVAEEAAAVGDRIGELTARLEEARLTSNLNATVTGERLLGLVGDARLVLEASGDDRALAAAALAESAANNYLLRVTRMGDAAARAVVHAGRAGDRRRELTGLTWVAMSLMYGPTPARDALDRLEREVDPVAPYRQIARALLLAMAGEFDEARAVILAERTRFTDLGGVIGIALSACNQGKIERLAGDPATAAAFLREGCDGLAAVGEQGYLSTYVVELGQALYELGRLDEASDCSTRGEALGSPDDLLTQMLWRQLRAKVLARRGELEAAERLASEAVEIGEPTDALEARADALADLAEVLELADRSDEASAALARALELYRQKGVDVSAVRVEARLASLSSAAT